MAFSFLYYPHIAIPNADWLRRVLLYSDVISSIVPMGYETRSYLPRHMQILREAGELEYIAPEEFLARSAFRNNFEDDVLDMLTSPEFERWLQTRRPTSSTRGDWQDWRWPLPPEEKYGLTWLSLEKTSDRIRDWFRSERLIPPDGHPVWVPVRSDIAHIYVGTLAKHISIHSHHPIAPATDKLSYEKAVIGRLGRQSTAKIPVADILLKKGMVVPRAETPLGEIISFKRHPAHWDELLEHRRFLREYQDRLSSASSPEELRDIAEDYEERLELGIQRVKRMMEKARLRTAITAVKALRGSKWSNAWTVVTSIVSVVMATVDASFFPPDRDRETTPFAYVFNATKHFGLHNVSRAWPDSKG